ncbi:MAG: hypothetical protein LBB45_01475 [Methanobrevibacter sp.]|jgi:archaellum component FlaC|nr:hypothetical protein [Candidatus Methanovirga basalitermitum]
MATGHIEKSVNEIEKRIEILKLIIEKIDKLSFEWAINSSNEQSYSGEIEDVLDDMEKLIDSVKDYKKI